ncbi:CPBP family intramembrane glutamic endopeptidase [Planococcus salinus]|uniref:CPBP family intramembrane metalloprotease n=1 Tax=Planococcus salinus TaxID=1848460 RepID=A0A3M8P5M5_9BACL|nr:type II CAAX endopeptidase family protein [Planococcus salinus]RNF38514.1 CPBP family intramembrane metalloprotease [Planococcus salinus]
MARFFSDYNLFILLPVAFGLYYLAFQDTSVFWYMYSFALLVLISFAIVYGMIFDEMVTWKSLIYGIGYGTVIYAIVAAGFQLLQLFPVNIEQSVESFLSAFAPTSIWHYLLLMFIIVPGEEFFWRGFVQQKLKQYLPTSFAILVASVLFGLALALGGFWPGMLAAIVAGAILGILYEWKKSMPAIIVTHLVMIVLLFLILPLPV